jgi:hypothetical protein
LFIRQFGLFVSYLKNWNGLFFQPIDRFACVPYNIDITSKIQLNMQHKPIFVIKRNLVGIKAFLMLSVLVSFFFFSSAVLASPNTDSLLGYWKFDNNGTDSSGDGSTATLNGTDAPTFDLNHAPTIFPDTKSLNLNTADGSVTFANQEGLRPLDALTFSFWIKPAAYPGTISVIGGNYLASYQNGFSFKFDGSSWVFSLGNDSTASIVSCANTMIPLDQWTHVLASWDGAAVRLYIDGVEESEGSFTVNPTYFVTAASAETGFRLNSFPGMIDDVRLYKRALTLAEIADLAAGEHTSATWTGAQDTDYGTAANWSPGAVPDPFALVHITAQTNQPRFTNASEALAGLEIDGGAVLDIAAYNLTVNDSGTFSNNGTLKLANINTQLLSGFVNDINSGVVMVENTSDVTGLKSGTSYYDLIVSGTAALNTSAALLVKHDLRINAGTMNLGANLSVDGSVYLQDGGLLDVSAGNYGINLKGSWNNTGGVETFNARSGTVYLLGSNQAISGSNTFYNLSKSVSATATLTFEAGATQTILNTFNLQGVGATEQYINLRSSTTGTQWLIDPQGTRNFAALDVQDSNNINATDIAAAGVRIKNSGNNTKWVFDATAPVISLTTPVSPIADATPTVSGTVADTQSVLAAIQFQVDSTAGSWSDCTATDGAVDELTEQFSCTPGTALTDGAHTIFVRAKDFDHNLTASSSVELVIDTNSPVISSVTANVADSGATISWTTSESASSQVAYGVSNSYGSVTSEMNTTTRVTTHSVTLSGLAACTTYHYQVISKDAFSQTAASSDAVFTTSGCDAAAPVITSVAATSQELTASIAWTTNEEASSLVRYGTSAAYGSETAEVDVDVRVTAHSVSLSGLAACTTYHYQVVSKDALGNQSAGDDAVFTTAGCAAEEESENDDEEEDECGDDDELDAPVLHKAEAQDAYSIKLSFRDGDGPEDHFSLQYGTESGSYQWKESDIGDKELENYLVGELKADTTYYFRIRSVNDCDTSSWSDEISAKTLPEEVAAGSNETTMPVAPLSQTGAEDLSATGSLPSAAASSNSSPEEDSSDADQLSTSLTGELDNSKEHYESPKEKGETRADLYAVTQVDMVETRAGKKLKVSGTGPANTTLTVYVYSEVPVILTVETDEDGNWSYILDKEIDDGEHQVYVAVTDTSGKINAKSEPLFFVKAAESVRVIPPAEAAGQVTSSVKKRSSRDLALLLTICAAAVVFSIGGIGLVLRKHRRNESEDRIIHNQ